MSLLDDVSIVVTPNGYKAGELYAVVPVPTEGAEEVDNNDFSTASDWTTGSFWDVSGDGLAVCSGSQTGNAYLTSLSGNAIIGRTYNVTIIVDVVNAGWTRVRVGGVDTGLISSADTYTYTIIATASTDVCRIQGNVDFDGTISNVSVKEYTAADMDVTRATAATRVDENGLVNYAEIVGSEEVTNRDFATDTDWTLYTGTTISGGKANINSGLGAYASVLKQNSVVTNGKYYKIEFEISDYVSGEAVMSIGYNTQLVVTSNGSYSFFGISVVGDNTNFIVRNGSTNFVGSIDNVSVKEVTRDNVPRIDYSGGGCPHILAEPQRTNLLPYSEDLTNAFYQTVGIGTITVSTTLSPDGTSYGYIITPTSITTNHYFNYQYGQLTVVIGDEVTYSIFVKPNGYNFIQIASSSGFPARYQNFELTGDGVIGTGDISGKTIEKIGDWYRCSVTETSSGVNPRFLLMPSETALATRNPVYSGNGTDGVLGWGVQVEVGSYATSYIPTNGQAGGVTRNQDIFSRDGISSLINSEEGVLFVEMAALSDDSVQKFISLGDGTTTNRLILGFDNSSNRVISFARVGGGLSFDIKVVLSDVQNYNKLAIKWKENYFALWGNGVELGVDSSGASFTSGVLSDLRFSDADGTTEIFNGKVKQLQVYTTALSDEQLIQLTGTSGTDFYESYAEMASALTYTIQ